MVDTHCHLNDDSYNDDINEVISSAFDEGIKYIIVPSTNPKDLEKTIKIAESNDKIFAAIGVHPHNASEVTKDVIEKIKELSNNEKTKAIGEIGLDYHYEYSSHQEQLIAFEKQFEIANEKSLPVILHNRESDEDMISFLKSNITKQTEGVFHCFSSDMKMLEKILEMNFFVSFTANITFAKTNLDEVVMNTPLNRLLLETDSPYMTPPPNRGKRNVPQTVKIVAEKISKIKQISIEEVINMTTENAKKLFRIPAISLLFTLLFFISSLFLLGIPSVYSQNKSNVQVDDGYYDDYDDYDPYIRRLGIGLLFGTNTFVDRYSHTETASQSYSSDGLFTYGALVNFKITEAMIIQGTYMSAQNDKFVKGLPDSMKNWLEPNQHKTIELSLIYMLVPEKMVNFYGSIGPSYFINRLSRSLGSGNKYFEKDDAWGINVGIGGFCNISLGSAGTLTLNAEWKLNFRPNPIKLDYDPRERPDSDRYKNPISYTTMYSIPRAGFIWYMPFLK